jgi:hypothetical protein
MKNMDDGIVLGCIASQAHSLDQISAKAPQQIFDSCFHSATDEAKAKASR